MTDTHTVQYSDESGVQVFGIQMVTVPGIWVSDIQMVVQFEYQKYWSYVCLIVLYQSSKHLKTGSDAIQILIHLPVRLVLTGSPLYNC